MTEIRYPVTIRLAADDAARVSNIVTSNPLSNRHAVVLAAARFGLRYLAAHPAEVIALLRDQGSRVKGR